MNVNVRKSVGDDRETSPGVFFCHPQSPGAKGYLSARNGDSTLEFQWASSPEIKADGKPSNCGGNRDGAAFIG